MQILTLTIIQIQDEDRPPIIFISGELPLEMAIHNLQNFRLEAAKEQGRREALANKPKTKKEAKHG